MGDRAAIPTDLGEVVDAYITRRLRALCKMIGGCDAPNCVMTNFDSKIQAIDHIIKKAGIKSASADLEPHTEVTFMVCRPACAGTGTENV